MLRPAARGPLSLALLDHLTDGPDRHAPGLTTEAARALRSTPDVVRDEDVQISLFLLYSLHYRGLDGVADTWEWNPGLLEVRAQLERAFEDRLRERVPAPRVEATGADGLAEALFRLAAQDDGPALSAYVARKATRDQAEEFLQLRSVYHLTEADPHTWAIPRLTGRAKAALVEIQSDEYGNGRDGLMHAQLFARTMASAGLDPTYGAYVDRVPAITLASMNMMSMFGLHRRLRGAIAGHLAAFEITSSEPNRRYASAFRRLGYEEDAAAYFDEHVEADAVHEQIAARDLAAALAEQEPEVRDDVLFGAAACLAVDGWAAQHQLDAWSTGRTALRQAVPWTRTALKSA